MRHWEQFTNQQQWREYLQNLLRTNKRALYRAIILIADKQTPEERAWGATIEKNNSGFGAVDAEMMTSLALRLKCGGELTERELAICRNKMPKYWRQLMIISKRRMEDERQARTKEEKAPDLEQGSELGNHSDGGGLYPDGHFHGKGPDGPGEESGEAQGIHSQPGETAG
jgi:hypothetical protein